MKYLILFILTSTIGITTFAQKSGLVHASKQSRAVHRLLPANSSTASLSANKVTAIGDTMYMAHIATSDTLSLYRVARDSGFVAGMDAYNDKAFAERYDFSSADSTVRVIGVIARFGGKVSPTTTRSVNFRIWMPAAKSSTLRNTLYNSGMPETGLAAQAVAFGDLGVSTVDTVEDSAKIHMFNYPTPYLSQSFFAGYSLTYTWGTAMAGDTIGLYSNKDGERTAPSYTVISDHDTTINNVNVTQYSDGTWHDNAVDNFHMSINLFVFPVITVGAQVTAAQGITRNSFTFFGGYPNPASSSTNIKIGLTAAADVTIELMDMSSHIVKTITNKDLAAGEHTIALNTTGLAAGDYIYLIRTSKGDGIASKLTITK